MNDAGDEARLHDRIRLVDSELRLPWPMRTLEALGFATFLLVLVIGTTAAVVWASSTMIEPSLWRLAPPVAWLLVLRRWVIPSLVWSARPDDIDARRAAKQRAADVAKHLEELAETGPVLIPRWRRVLVAAVGWAAVLELVALVALIWLPPALGENLAEPLLIALVLSLTAWSGLQMLLIPPSWPKRNGR